MSTVTLHPFGAGPTRNRAIASAAPAAPSLPGFWSSVVKRAAVPARNSPPAVEKPSAVVGDLWIQIR